MNFLPFIITVLLGLIMLAALLMLFIRMGKNETLDGKPCRHPDRMHPCVESHGINLIPTLEENGLEFQYGGNIITWYSLLFYNP